MSGAKGWGALIAVGDKSKEAQHLDRLLHKECDVASAPLVGPDLTLYLASTTIGRILMHAEGGARAAAQFADVLLDVPSGTTRRDATPANTNQHFVFPSTYRILAPYRTSPNRRQDLNR